MIIDKENLPHDPELLREMLIEVSDKATAYEKELRDEQFRYRLLEEKYLTLQKRFFAKKSEKLSKEDQEQMLLFNEAEDGSGDDATEDMGAAHDYTAVKGHTRRKRGRRPLPDTLPREEVVHDLSDKDKTCSCCGNMRPRIGTEESEELDIVPAQVKVVKHIRLKYGPCDCDEFLNQGIPEVVTASMPARMIPHSIVSPGLLAYVITSKYADSLPFYRQSKIFKRIDLDISRATLCNWAIRAAEKCEALIALMKEDIRGGPLIQMDETTVQVLHEEGRAPESKSYMWVAMGYSDSRKPIILYEYHTGRSQEIPAKFLDGYTGYVQTDGYAGYNKAGTLPGIIHVGCFTHARRYFHEALKLSKKSNIAHKGLGYIQKLYRIEKEMRARELSPDDFVEKRKNDTSPLLDEFHNWLAIKVHEVPPQSKIGQAVHYTLNEWHKLIRYLDSDFLTPDNNRVENAIRPFVVGRKNWLFSNTPRGAHASAALYSIIETAKANGLEPYRYLRYLFTHLPRTESGDETRSLLPYNVSVDALMSV